MNFINLIKIYLRSICHHAYFLFLLRPVLRLLAIIEKHHFRFIEKTKVIGDRDFISYCEDFSQCLRKIDPSMYDDLFIKNKFVFTQYSDVSYYNALFGEYGVPARFQKLKANGIGAWMIYGFFCTKSSGRTLESYIRYIRQPGHSRPAKEKTYMWLTEHQFPDPICGMFKKMLQR